MVKLQVVLDPVEADALAQWAASELRDPRDQIRMVLRQELKRRGLWPVQDGDRVNAEQMSPEEAVG